jgi:hypothetical protein
MNLNVQCQLKCEERQTFIKNAPLILCFLNEYNGPESGLGRNLNFLSGFWLFHYIWREHHVASTGLRLLFLGTYQRANSHCSAYVKLSIKLSSSHRSDSPSDHGTE